MCNWVIISLANTCSCESLASPEPPLLRLPKRGLWEDVVGGCLLQEHSPLAAEPPEHSFLWDFHKAFVNSCVPTWASGSRTRIGGLSPQQGLQGGAATSDFTKPWVCTKSFASSSRNKVGTNNERDSWTSWNAPQSCQWTSREWLSGDSKSKLMMEKMSGSPWRARSVLSCGIFTQCMHLHGNTLLCGALWQPVGHRTTSPHLLLFCCLLSTS